MEQDQAVAVSFIVRAYNAEATIRRALESALTQDFSSAYEIVVIDDGCTDRTVDIVRTFDDDRIQLIQQEHAGIVEGGNAGFLAARGGIIMFLDADDEALPQTLSLARDSLSDPGIDFAYGDYVEEYRGERRRVHASDPFKVPAGAMCWRRESVIAEGGFTSGTIFPEYELLLSTWSRWESVHIGEPLFVYHRGDSSLTGSRNAVRSAIKTLQERFPERSAEIELIRSYDPLAA